VPHMDCKALVDRRIKQELPELAAKTTYMYLGYYPQNMFTFPFLKPIEFVSIFLLSFLSSPFFLPVIETPLLRHLRACVYLQQGVLTRARHSLLDQGRTSI